MVVSLGLTMAWKGLLLLLFSIIFFSLLALGCAYSQFFFCFSGGGLERLGCVVLRRLALRHGSSVDMVCRVWGFCWSGDAHTYGDEQVM